MNSCLLYFVVFYSFFLIPSQTMAATFGEEHLDAQYVDVACQRHVAYKKYSKGAETVDEILVQPFLIDEASRPENRPLCEDERFCVHSKNSLYFLIAKADPAITYTDEGIDSYVRAYGSIKLNQLISDIRAQHEKRPFHPSLSNLIGYMIEAYTENPYIGTSPGKRNLSSGWFGGLSLPVLNFLSELAFMQDRLAEDQKMEFLGIASGNAFFEWMLSHVGVTKAMDVISVEAMQLYNYRCVGLLPGSAITEDKLKMMNDYTDLTSFAFNDRLFMSLDVYIKKSETDAPLIIQKVFKDLKSENTVLVLSWPREFAIDYIQDFLSKGGRTILFVRGGSCESVFCHDHLGDPSNSARAEILKSMLDSFHHLSLPLYTSSNSILDLYSIDEDNSVACAIKEVLGQN